VTASSDGEVELTKVFFKDRLEPPSTLKFVVPAGAKHCLVRFTAKGSALFYVRIYWSEQSDFARNYPLARFLTQQLWLTRPREWVFRLENEEDYEGHNVVELEISLTIMGPASILPVDWFPLVASI
jgi:hypothetical protein